MTLISEERIEEHLGAISNALGRNRYLDDAERETIRHALRGIARETAEACADICKWSQHSPGSQLSEEIRRRMQP